MDNYHKEFTTTLSYRLPITLSDAILGTSLNVKTLFNEPETIVIKPGTYHKDQIVLTGKGMIII